VAHNMEATICPWCQTEIVWDEELGPEEECPYCHNELDGYRTLTFDVDSAGSEEELNNYGDEEGGHDHLYAQSGKGASHLFHAAGHDPLVYEAAVEKLLDTQDVVPECPHCREYMIFSGHHVLGENQFKAAILPSYDKPLLQSKLQYNVFVCPSCFHVSQFLDDKDRLPFMKAISKEED
jgi:hypothetical protein